MSDPLHSSSSATSGPLSHSVERLRREFERWLEAALQQGGRALDAVGLRGAERPWSPFVDLIETPTEVHVNVDLPGVEPGLVDVSLIGNMLTIQVPRKPCSLPEGAVPHLMERVQGPSQRSVPMPAQVVPESVTAELQHGVLRLRMLKSVQSRAVKIPVRSDPASARTPLPSVPVI